MERQPRKHLQGSPAYAIARRRTKVREQERMDKGLCVRCGVRPATASGQIRKPPFRFCLECRDKKRVLDVELHHRQRAERLEAGRCTYCGVRVQEGELRCDACRQKARDKTRLWRARGGRERQRRERGGRERQNKRQRALYAQRKAQREETT